MKKRNRAALLNFSRLFKIYIFIHFAQVFFFPNIFPENQGSLITQEIYFLGIRNQIGQQLIPMTSIVMIISYMKEKKRSPLIFVLGFLAIITSIKTNSSTGIIAIIVLYMLYCLFGIIPNSVINIKNTSIGYIVGNVLLVFGQVISNIPIVANIIQRYFGKDASFSNRTVIWVRSYENFKNSYLLGIGRHQGKSVMTFHAQNQYDKDTSYSAHNVLLQTIVESGIIGLIPIAILIVITINRSSRCRNQNYLLMIVIGIIAVMVTFLMEAYDLTYFLILLGFIFNIDKMESIFDKRKYVKKESMVTEI